MTFSGDELLAEIARRVTKEKGTKTITDSVLAKEIGITQPALANYRGKDVTAKQAVNLMEKYARKAELRIVASSVVPIVEFFPLNPTKTSQEKSWQIFTAFKKHGGDHPYYRGLKEQLESTHGIYIFHDSRGRAIYAGKAQKQSLWAEMNNAFNRDRREVQSIKRVRHPSSGVAYKGPDEKKRQITKEIVTLYHIAKYASAYQVTDGLIGKLEALIVRTFANDLLNVRMENF
ncbi:MAG: hypothetical protein RBS99_14015 [Rhodospirillales bacterium]|jgi:hypothetical protein|nr:hypothetical protein [Rhodospirillales bacterium]